MTEILACKDLGIISYETAYHIQLNYHQACLNHSGLSTILTLEHPPVITLGKNADYKFLKVDQTWLTENSIDVIQTDRGGQITAHMPGQLMVYPIIDLRVFKLTSKQFIEILETVLLNLLADYKIVAHTDKKYPGIWREDKKICAIGVRIKDRITMHGLALNVFNSLELFNKIIPCGIAERGVISMAEILSYEPNMTLLKLKLIEKLKSRLLDFQT